MRWWYSLLKLKWGLGFSRYPIASLDGLNRQYKGQKDQLLNVQPNVNTPLEESRPLIKQQKALKAKLEKVAELAALHKEIGSWFADLKIIEEAFTRQDGPALLAELNNDEDKIKAAGFVGGWNDLLRAIQEKKVTYEAIMNQITDDNILARHAEFMGKVEEIKKEVKLIHQLCFG